MKFIFSYISFLLPHQQVKWWWWWWAKRHKESIIIKIEWEREREYLDYSFFLYSAFIIPACGYAHIKDGLISSFLSLSLDVIHFFCSHRKSFQLILMKTKNLNRRRRRRKKALIILLEKKCLKIIINHMKSWKWPFSYLPLWQYVNYSHSLNSHT